MANYFNNSDKDAELYLKYRSAKKIVGIISKNKIELEEYSNIIDPDDKFIYLMKYYEKLEPFWKNEYNRNEESKPSERQAILPSNYSMDDYINSALGDEITTRALSMHVANKIAHICEYSMKQLLEYHLNKEQINLDPDQFDYVLNRIRLLFLNKDGDNKRIYERLLDNKIDSNFIQLLENDGIESLCIAQKNAFAIKDLEITQLINKLPETDISYGKCTIPKKDSQGKIVYVKNKDGSQTEKAEHLFVIDLPYFDQLAVHLKTPESISALSETPYDRLRIYNTRTVLLTEEQSKQAEHDFKTQDITIDKLVEMAKTNFEYTYYLGIKIGATKEELDRIYDGSQVDPQIKDRGEDDENSRV